MRNSILKFTEKKSSKKYKSITIFICFSIIILNLVLQTISLTVQTIYNEMLNSTNLSLILVQNYDQNAKLFDMDIEDIEKISGVQFVVKAKAIGFMGEDQDGVIESFNTYPIPSEYSYYVGIDEMKDNTIYCSSDYYKDVEKYKLSDVDDSVQLLEYDYSVPMIFSDSCFMSEKTYHEIIDKLPSESYTKYVADEYIIGVDNVKNVFDVVKGINNLYPDDDPTIMYQANGLESLVNNASQLLVILSIVFVILMLFNAGTISFLSSSLVGSLSRDLMVLYLNGMSRKDLSKELNQYCRKYFTNAIYIASIISILIFVLIMQYVLHQPMNIMWIVLILLIDILVIVINTLLLKVFISKMVANKTSNNNISKIIRN